MKSKKKNGVSSKKGGKKVIVSKPVIVVDKTIITTKEKTHATIEETFQINDHKSSSQPNKNLTPRKSTLQKMQECNLSPFSSPEKSSVSPRFRKLISPEKVKRVKGKRRSIGGRINRLSRQEENQVAYENEVIKRMNEKKITQRSEESQMSIKKLPKLILRMPLKRSKCDMIRQMKLKIQEKYSKIFPDLSSHQMSFLTIVVVIQRLWRQRRTKRMISDFMSPRSLPLDQNVSKLDTTLVSQEHTTELIRKYQPSIKQRTENFKRDDREMVLKENQNQPLTNQKVQQLNSTELQTSKKTKLKELELSEDLQGEKEEKWLRLVECLRDVSLTTSKKTQRKVCQRINVFNLQQSLSQKCLMQRFYEKVFKDSPTKRNNFEIFTHCREKQLEKSIELIAQLANTVPEQLEEPLEVTPLKQEKEEELFVQEIKAQELHSLKNYNHLAESIINGLLDEFGEQFLAFRTKSCLKKKKKASLPGLNITVDSVRTYLEGFSCFILANSSQELNRRFFGVKAASLLKIHHQYCEQREQDEEEEEDMINLPVVPNEMFYQYQCEYENTKFVVSSQNQKYKNFLQCILKVHNLALSNYLCQFLDRCRIDRMVLPWDHCFEGERNRNQEQVLQRVIQQSIKAISKACFMRVGRLHPRSQSEEERVLLNSIRHDYQVEGNEWKYQYEILQLRMQVSRAVENLLIQQVALILV